MPRCEGPGGRHSRGRDSEPDAAIEDLKHTTKDNSINHPSVCSARISFATRTPSLEPGLTCGVEVGCDAWKTAVACAGPKSQPEP